MDLSTFLGLDPIAHLLDFVLKQTGTVGFLRTLLLTAPNLFLTLTLADLVMPFAQPALAVVIEADGVLPSTQNKSIDRKSGR